MAVDIIVTITFKPDGSAMVNPSGADSFELASTGGSPAHKINLNTATSREQVDLSSP